MTLDAVLVHLLLRPDAGKHQELRCVERAARENDLARGERPAFLAGGIARLRMSAVKTLAFEVLDAVGRDCPCRKALGWQERRLDRQLIGMLFAHGQNALTASDTAMTAST